MASGTTESLLNAVYPVGAIYMSVNSTDPGTLFGGTWERITGRFLLAATDGGSSGASQGAGNTGGEATHTLTETEIPAHTHGQATLTGTFVIRNGDSIDVLGACSGIVSRSNYDTTYANAVARVTKTITPHVGNINASHTHTSVGGNGAHNNMPPYLAVYVWKRTA